jgi:hypothetical protein
MPPRHRLREDGESKSFLLLLAWNTTGINSNYSYFRFRVSTVLKSLASYLYSVTCGIHRGDVIISRSCYCSDCFVTDSKQLRLDMIGTRRVKGFLHQQAMLQKLQHCLYLGVFLILFSSQHWWSLQFTETPQPSRCLAAATFHEIRR